MQHIGPLSSSVCPIVRNLGVLFDHSLSFNTHRKSPVKSCFLHLRNISKLRAVVSQADMEILIHSFISSRIDYCNALFSSLNKKLFHHLQSIQNAAAKLLTRSNKYSHVTPLLHSINWLPVTYKIQFKILTITDRALHGQAPTYLSDLIHIHTASRTLRSSH